MTEGLQLRLKDQLGLLVESIGGEKALFATLEKFYQRMANDSLIGFFFSGRNLPEIAQKQTDFILHAAGKKEDYRFHPPAEAHLELPPILPGHFDRRKVLLKEVLLEEKLSNEFIEIWLKFEEAFRGVVEKRNLKT